MMAFKILAWEHMIKGNWQDMAEVMSLIFLVDFWKPIHLHRSPVQSCQTYALYEKLFVIECNEANAFSLSLFQVQRL